MTTVEPECRCLIGKAKKLYKETHLKEQKQDGLFPYQPSYITDNSFNKVYIMLHTPEKLQSLQDWEFSKQCC
jgi:hypothetical protein